jgi:uncharacterized protein (DUF885 family)
MLSCSVNSGEDLKFEQIAGQYLDRLLDLSPETATWMGEHKYDHRMNDYSLKGYTEKLEFYKGFKEKLETIQSSELNSTNRIDYEIFLNDLNYRIFSLDTIRSYEWNPRRYNPGGAIYALLARDFAPLNERMKNVKSRLEAIPEILEQAKVNLKNPPRIHTETAIRQIQGTINLINVELNEYLDKVPDLIDEVKPAQERAVSALKDYGEWLEKDLLPRSTGDFRLGDKLYRIKLNYSLESDLTKEEILRRAESELIETQEKMYQTALPLFKEYFPDQDDESILTDEKKVIRTVLDHLAEDHPTADNIVDRAKTCLQECTDFIRENDLVTLPDKSINIIVMPEFQRGVAVAYCSSPGVLEKDGETFYAISPPPADWNEEQVESYFREYNNQLLYNLTVHEAMPGHYLQAAHANNFKAPTMIRSIIGSGTYSEGWATYCEQLMVEKGFGGAELKMQMLKMRLRMIINAIIDQKIHTEGMTEQEAMDLMLNEGFQEQGEAAGKWRRACLSSVQLTTYYAGNIAINDIRDAYETKMGEQFNLREFHDKLLSFGNPAPKYLVELLEL